MVELLRESGTETVDMGSILGRVKPGFLFDVQCENRQCEAPTVCGSQVGRLQRFVTKSSCDEIRSLATGETGYTVVGGEFDQRGDFDHLG